MNLARMHAPAAVSIDEDEGMHLPQSPARFNRGPHRPYSQGCLPVFSAAGLFEGAGIGTWATDEFQTRAQCRAVAQYSVVSQSAESSCGQ